jgi:site-specific DNA recombinase
MHCGKCGAKMRYQKWGKRDCKIVCYSQDKNKPHLIKDPDCDNIKLWATDIEDTVIKDLFVYSFDQSKINPPQISNMALIDILHDQYNLSATKLKRLYGLYADSEDEVLLDSINEIRKEMNKIQKQIENETEKSKNQINFASLKRTLSDLSEAWEYMTPKERKVVINDCVNRIVITDTNIHVDYKFNIAEAE